MGSEKSAGGSYRLAIDVGGTFTDVVMIDARSGAMRFGKVLSTPDDPSRGSLAGAREVLDANGVAASEVGELVHATTVATNAVLERKGARTGLIATRGFRDTLAIGREARYDIYDLGLVMPEPLVPRRLRREIAERLDAEGRVLRAPSDEEIDAVLDRLVAREGIEALAVCLLHAYADPRHEERVATRAAARYPALAVSLSSRVAGEMREYERSSTTVVDAYVKPLVRHYMARLEDGLREAGFRQRVAVMLSHGGIAPAREAAEAFPVRIIESGPAAGAIAAAQIARQALNPADAIAFDMGGTTAKISVVRDGAPAIAREYEVAHVHRFKRGSGYPLQIAAIELLEIGAGGGSIAEVSALGLLSVGPHSAGAAPGPACYARGGDRPTVTDADLLLGYLDPDHFLGGAMRLDRDAAAAAMARHLGDRLGMGVDQVAWGIHDVVNERMAAATRAHAVEKGIDLRRFALIAFGGAGPIHAYAMARKLGLARVVCPVGAGVASAIGCLAAVPGVELVRAHAAPLASADWAAIGAQFEAMRVSGERSLASLIGDGARLALRAAMELRCEGQGYSVIVELPEAASLDARLAAPLAERFATTYAQLYGHAPPAIALEIVNLRARVESPRAMLRPHLERAGASDAAAALRGRRKARFDAHAGFVEAAVYDRYRLPTGVVLRGPALVEERETTSVVGPDARFHLDPGGNLVIDLDPRPEARP